MPKYDNILIYCKYIFRILSVQKYYLSKIRTLHNRNVILTSIHWSFPGTKSTESFVLSSATITKSNSSGQSTRFKRWPQRRLIGWTFGQRYGGTETIGCRSIGHFGRSIISTNFIASDSVQFGCHPGHCVDTDQMCAGTIAAKSPGDRRCPWFSVSLSRYVACESTERCLYELFAINLSNGTTGNWFAKAIHWCVSASGCNGNDKRNSNGERTIHE